MEVFGKFKDDSRLKTCWDIPQYLTEADNAIPDQTDHDFWDGAGETMAERAYAYYHDEMKKTPRNTPGQGEAT